ncbi:hypothetical protein BpHYR1_027729 [Brachionus plicatilis]|uniref:Uncharacterized protein n=1 Tax=Brachionus plicatilis TaxID=10195 RepID=A0A3M7SL23_BRAPC|nr:hypothetical protein BpHYR1_027729 [Brachionus plicatilis]
MDWLVLFLSGSELGGGRFLGSENSVNFTSALELDSLGVGVGVVSWLTEFISVSSLEFSSWLVPLAFSLSAQLILSLASGALDLSMCSSKSIGDILFLTFFPL